MSQHFTFFCIKLLSFYNHLFLVNVNCVCLQVCATHTAVRIHLWLFPLIGKSFSKQFYEQFRTVVSGMTIILFPSICLFQQTQKWCHRTHFLTCTVLSTVSAPSTSQEKTWRVWQRFAETEKRTTVSSPDKFPYTSMTPSR